TAHSLPDGTTGACSTMPLNMRPRPPAQRRPTTPGGLVAWFNVYGSFRQIIQDLVAPTLEAIQGDIRALNARIDSVNSTLSTKVDSLEATLSAKIDALNGKIDSVEATLNGKIDALNGKIDSLETT